MTKAATAQTWTVGDNLHEWSTGETKSWAEPTGPTGVLADAANSITAGQSVNLLTLGTPVPLSGITDAQFAWQARFHYDPINEKCAVFGKAPGSTVGFHMRRYDLATNAWATIWDNVHNANGHIYGHNAMDPATGDSYFHLYLSDSGWRLTQDSEIALPAHGFSYLSTFADGAGWHPNLYGPGDGGYVYFMVDKIIAWRKSTNTWAQIHSHPINDGGSSYGQAEYLEDDDALYQFGLTAHTAWKITPNATIGDAPVVVAATNAPFDIAAASASVGTVSALLKHPSDTGRLLALQEGGEVREFNGTAWSDPGYNHPFTITSQGWSLCSIAPLGAIWKLDDVSSVLWKPDS